MSRIQDSILSAKKAHEEFKRAAALADAKPGAKPAEAAVARPAATSKLVLDLRPGKRTRLDPNRLEKNRIVHEENLPDGLNPFKMLRTRVLQRMGKHDWRTLAVTAAHESAGKTVTAINLAITIAQGGGDSVYLLDLDLRKPGLARSLGITEINTGLGDYLSGRSKLSEVLWDIGIDNLIVVPGLGRFNNSSELITSKLMSDLIAAIRSDPADPIVIIDLPPVLATDDVLAIAPIVDTLLFVVAEGETKRGDMLNSNEILKDVDVVGVVLNKSRDPQPGY